MPRRGAQLDAVFKPHTAVPHCATECSACAMAGPQQLFGSPLAWFVTDVTDDLRTVSKWQPVETSLRLNSTAYELLLTPYAWFVFSLFEGALCLF